MPNPALQRQFVEIVQQYVRETGINPPDFAVVVKWAEERGMLGEETTKGTA